MTTPLPIQHTYIVGEEISNRFVQVLWAVTQDIYPTAPNLYTLINEIPGDNEWYSVLDLKDDFFYVPVNLASQPLFAFAWQEPETMVKTQYCWIVLP